MFSIIAAVIEDSNILGLFRSSVVICLSTVDLNIHIKSTLYSMNVVIISSKDFVLEHKNKLLLFFCLGNLPKGHCLFQNSLPLATTLKHKSIFCVF